MYSVCHRRVLPRSVAASSSRLWPVATTSNPWSRATRLNTYRLESPHTEQVDRDPAPTGGGDVEPVRVLEVHEDRGPPRALRRTPRTTSRTARSTRRSPAPGTCPTARYPRSSRTSHSASESLPPDTATSTRSSRPEHVEVVDGPLRPAPARTGGSTACRTPRCAGGARSPPFPDTAGTSFGPRARLRDDRPDLHVVPVLHRSFRVSRLAIPDHQDGVRVDLTARPGPRGRDGGRGARRSGRGCADGPSWVGQGYRTTHEAPPGTGRGLGIRSEGGATESRPGAAEPRGSR